MEKITVEELIECRMKAIAARAQQIADYPWRRDIRTKESRKRQAKLKERGDVDLRKRRYDGKPIPRIEGWRKNETEGLLSRFLSIGD